MGGGVDFSGTNWHKSPLGFWINFDHIYKVVVRKGMDYDTNEESWMVETFVIGYGGSKFASYSSEDEARESMDHILRLKGGLG